MDLRQFHGVVKKCETCTNPDLPMDCRRCFCRGYLAVCLNCSGTGQITSDVAGSASGTMRSTCDKCGGTGFFSARKPEEVEEDTEAELMFASSNLGVGSLSMAAATISSEEMEEDEDSEDDSEDDLSEDTASASTVVALRPDSISKRVWKKFTQEQRIAAVSVNTASAEGAHIATT